MLRNKCSLIALLSIFSFWGYAQEKEIDKIIVVIGDNIILQSDLEAQYMQIAEQEKNIEDVADARCSILEQLMFQKLLLNQAKLDSLKVTESQIESEMDRRLRFFISQIGSEQKLEEYYGKSLSQIKNEFKDQIKNQLLAQQMQSKITNDITITPSEVRRFFKNIPADSLPFINSELEFAQIVVHPKISEEAKSMAKEKIEGLRQRVLKGEKFGALAVLYSEDPGSAKKSGELGFVTRGSFVPEFEAVAFRLKEGELSEVIETQFGYHFMQLVERRGEQINVKHILITPKIAPEDMVIAKNKLDSIYALLMKTDTLSFGEAAALFSDDKETKFNNGLLINPYTGTTKFEADQVEPSMFFILDKLKIGEISKPVSMQTPTGKQAFRMLFLKSRGEPHQANLTDDYQRIKDAALEEKKENAISKWIDKRMANTYFKLDANYNSCVFMNFNKQIK